MDVVKIFKALGHEFRFRVVRMLLEGNIRSCCGELRSYEQGCCVSDLTDKFDIPQSTISHHLSVLADAGIVTLEKRGLWSIYLLNPNTLNDLKNTLCAWDACCNKSVQVERCGSESPLST